VLLRGPSGAGKSDLALRLIDGGAVLVSDDQVALHDAGHALLASPPTRIAGMIEVRGLGIATMAHVTEIPLSLVVDLISSEAVERMPDSATTDLMGHHIRWIALSAFDGSTPAKVRLASAQATASSAGVSRAAAP
jgi:serine kinase of HPr protein (carbohydrate metabolism regulator)